MVPIDAAHLFRKGSEMRTGTGWAHEPRPNEYVTMKIRELFGVFCVLLLWIIGVSGQDSPGGTITTSRPYLIDSQVVDIQAKRNELK